MLPGLDPSVYPCEPRRGIGGVREAFQHREVAHEDLTLSATGSGYLTMTRSGSRTPRDDRAGQCVRSGIAVDQPLDGPILSVARRTLRPVTEGDAYGMDQSRPGRLSEPHPAALVESLRALGYGLATALADLIDNSITAKAREVRIEFCSDPGGAWLAIVDDGEGMTEPQLDEAMRLGTIGPHALRRPGDLGRFGLGLKTASFSQARRLTVHTSQAGGISASRTWDLEIVTKTDEWRLLDELDTEAAQIISQLDLGNRGTVVLWRTTDRAGEGAALVDAIGRAKAHLAAVFGRYLSGGKLKISVGGQYLAAWDPFLARNTLTQDLGSEVLEYDGGMAKVTLYVLPHPSRLTAAESSAAEGSRGWHGHQGFYVFRGDRLLTTGGWLGLRGLPASPQARLARLAVDIAPADDHDWQVDVRKSRVQPPSEIRQRLKELAEYARQRSEQVFRHRGTPLSRLDQRNQNLTFVWQPNSQRGEVGYRVNREHPVIAEALSGSERHRVEAVLRLVERTVPVGMIAVDAASSPDRTPQAALDGAEPDEVRDLLASIIAGLPPDPATRAAVLGRLGSAEPFNRFPDVLAEITEGARRADGSA